MGSPFQELGLVNQVTLGGKPTIQLSRGPKHSLDTGALGNSFSMLSGGEPATGSKTLSLRSLMLSHAAPGMVLLLDESSLYEKLDELCTEAKRLVLRSDGAGGVDLSSKGNPLRDLETVAWQ